MKPGNRQGFTILGKVPIHTEVCGRLGDERKALNFTCLSAHAEGLFSCG